MKRKKKIPLRKGHYIEYRNSQYGPLNILFLGEFNAEKALIEANKLKDKQCHDVIIRINE